MPLNLRNSRRNLNRHARDNIRTKRAIRLIRKNLSPRRIFKNFTQGVYNGAQMRAHLHAVRRLQSKGDDSFEHNYLYDCLSILDTKVQGLLTFDSIIVATTTLVLATLSPEITIGSILIFIALVLSGTSSLLALSVIWVYWTDTDNFEHSTDLFTELLGIRNKRTVAYRLSWLAAHGATIILIIGVFLQRRLG